MSSVYLISILTSLCQLVLLICVVFFFFKQKTAYEMRISDWSSDVCSSDLQQAIGIGPALVAQAQRAGGEIVDMEPGKARAERRRRQQRDVGAETDRKSVV